MTTVADIVIQTARNLRALKYNSGLAALDTTKYLRQEIVDAINAALLEAGPFQMVDETYQTVADQEVYIFSYPSLVSIDRIRIGANATAPTDWGSPLHHWWHDGNTLYFHPDFKPATSDLWMQITYSGHHTAVSADGDAITDQINPGHLSWLAAYHAAAQRVRTQGNDDRLKEFLVMAQQQAAILGAQHPIRRVEKDSHFSTY